MTPILVSAWLLTFFLVLPEGANALYVLVALVADAEARIVALTSIGYEYEQRLSLYFND